MPLFKGCSLCKHSWSPDQRQPLPLPARGVEMRDTQRIVFWQRQFLLGKMAWALDSSFLYSVLLLCLLDDVRARPQFSGLFLIHGHFLGELIQSPDLNNSSPKAVAMLGYPVLQYGTLYFDIAPSLRIWCPVAFMMFSGISNMPCSWCSPSTGKLPFPLSHLSGKGIATQCLRP